MEAREAAKRKAGGRISANVALHVDETGVRWKRMVNLGLAAAVVLALAVIAWMIRATMSEVDPREGNAEAYKMAEQLAAYASRPGFFKEGDHPSAEKVRERLKEAIEAEYKKEVEEMERDKSKKNKYATPDEFSVKERDWLGKLRLLQDAWGQPFAFEVSGDTLKISVVGKKTRNATPPEPVTVRLHGAAAAEKSPP